MGAQKPDFLDDPDWFTIRAVVQGGQIVLDTPLDVADGTYVTIRPYVHGDIRGLPGPPAMMTEEQREWFREDGEWLRARAAARRAGPEAA